MGDSIGQVISVQLIPVLLLPVTGLLLMVLYNKYFAIEHRIRLIQSKLSDNPLKEIPSAEKKDFFNALQIELKELSFRSKFLLSAIFFLLISVFSFSLCAIFAALSYFSPGLINLAFVFWFIGPVLICVGMVIAICDLFLTLKTISFETNLIDRWSDINPNK